MIISFLNNVNLSHSFFCRAQTYDEAGNMAGHLNGCSDLFRKKVPKATYYHCASHDLNLGQRLPKYLRLSVCLAR